MLSVAQALLETDDIARLAEAWEGKAPQEILGEAVRRIGDLVFACSFGPEDMAILDMLAGIRPGLPIFYLDTDVLFAETYELRDRAVGRYRPNLIRVRPEVTLAQQAERFGAELWKSHPDLCCDLRKVRPLAGFLAGRGGWITGVRRDQAPTRAHARVFEWDGKFGLVKVNPLAAWTQDEVWSYIRERGVPYNPLHDRGYPSIGCLHCTRPVAPGEDPRSGRWAGRGKTECGLHK